jgi:ribosomal protein S6
MPTYCLLLTVKPLPNAAEKVASLVSRTISQHGGLVRRINNSGVRALPYALHGVGIGEKFLFANMLSVEFLAKPALLQEIKVSLRGSQETLRSSVLKADDTLLRAPPRADPHMSKVQGIDPSKPRAPPPDLYAPPRPHRPPFAPSSAPPQPPQPRFRPPVRQTSSSAAAPPSSAAAPPSSAAAPPSSVA